MKEYKEKNGTSYHAETSNKVMEVLEMVREKQFRITLDLGDTKTNKSWNEVHDISGYIGRSTGPNKVPILLHNKRSMGGGAISTHCILSIRFSNKKEGDYLYKKETKAK